MATIARDPLVTVLRAIIAFLMAVFGFAMVILAAGFVGVPFFHADIAAEIAKDAKDIGVWQAIALIEGMIAGVLILLAMIEYFLLQLWRMLATVREGDPFVPINSIRLTRMAWTALAANVWAVLLGLYGTLLETHLADEANEVDVDFGFSGAGPILILVLFVLARVFRKGTEMREDLEGTV